MPIPACARGPLAASIERVSVSICSEALLGAICLQDDSCVENNTKFYRCLVTLLPTISRRRGSSLGSGFEGLSNDSPRGIAAAVSESETAGTLNLATSFLETGDSSVPSVDTEPDIWPHCPIYPF